ncbi:sensor histidine kinase [Schumannella soli]|uniref:histidine kinase n=1 Tax=Schumannella soli TaxID=2590779 RepID=A0A506XY34_9MICO|nr:HAMP domain-containing sensor histidine kinase [Schumannella soli]TPW74197.1 HAMP domain-containing histidine kinase [Schumannella soli]
MRRWRIRTRLVVGTSIMAALLLTVALLVARAEITRLLHDSGVSLARSDLTSFATDLQRNPDEGPDAVANGLLIVIRAPDGTTVRDTAPHDVRQVIAATADGTDFTLDDDEGRSYVIVSERVATSDGVWSMWAARDVSSSRSAVSGIDTVFLLTGAGLLVVVIGASWMLARGALRPVEELRRHAQALDAAELLPVADNDDELARLAATLNGFVQRVRASADRERQMVSDAAHELRTPLATLGAELELTRRRLDDPAGVEAGLAAATTSVDRLTGLATNLLELSRLDDGGAHDASETGAEVLDDVLAAIDRARVRVADLDIEIDDEVKLDDPAARYRVEPLALSRVADNLLANAIRAVERTGRIVVTLDDHGDEILLRVDDDGPGAPEDFLPRAFERFARPDDARRRPGSGLGLALVRAVAVAAGGDARVQNLAPGFRAEARLPKM